LAVEVAAGSGDGIGEAAGQNVEKRFFFHRVHMHGTRVAVNQGVIFAPPVLSHPAVAPVAVKDLTGLGTQKALDLVIR